MTISPFSPPFCYPSDAAQLSQDMTRLVLRVADQEPSDTTGGGPVHRVSFLEGLSLFEGRPEKAQTNRIGALRQEICCLDFETHPRDVRRELASARATRWINSNISLE
jgi:hypothetical protein